MRLGDGVDCHHFQLTAKLFYMFFDEYIFRFGYCCIVAGCCMSIGIKFAGSTNKAAFETLVSLLVICF